MATVSRNQYSRASDMIEGIGDRLDKIADRDLLLHDFTVNTRPMGGDNRAFVSMQISELNTPEDIKTYHAWSESLAEKIGQLDKTDLPLVINFTKVRTASGYEVWSVQ